MDNRTNQDVQNWLTNPLSKLLALFGLSIFLFALIVDQPTLVLWAGYLPWVAVILLCISGGILLLKKGPLGTLIQGIVRQQWIRIVAVVVLTVASSTAPGAESFSMAKTIRQLGEAHKITVSAEDAAIRQILLGAGAHELADYSSFWLLLADDSTLGTLTAEQRERIQIRDDFDTITLGSLPLDTMVGEPAIPEVLRAQSVAGKQLYLVQFVGPIQDVWLENLTTAGVKIITYVPQNAYVVWTDSNALAQMQVLNQKDFFIQWQSPFHPFYKLQPTLLERINAGQIAEDSVDVTIQVVQHEGADLTLGEIRALASEILRPAHPILKYFNTTVRIPANELQRVANMADVFAIEPFVPPVRLDERQGQIIAGNLNAAGTEPAGAGYLSWLAGRGFSTVPGDYPIVDVADDGFDTGNAASPAHNDFYELGNPANSSRVVYAVDATSDNNPHGLDGHGDLNVSIVGGYNDTQTGLPYEDAAGYQFGLGNLSDEEMRNQRVSYSIIEVSMFVVCRLHHIYPCCQVGDPHNFLSLVGFVYPLG